MPPSRGFIVSCLSGARVLPALHVLPARRTLFGLGEIAGVLANPAETVRSLTESKKLLDEARQELKDSKERKQIPPKHTFSPLPGFFGREREIKALERALAGSPNLTVLFGASSVGKTALLREILSRDKYHCLHFDLRIAGFADLASLYYSLSLQMEQFFASMQTEMGEEYAEFEKEGWRFKHDRAAMDQKLERGGEVKTADIAKTMELFQSSLLKYWNFEPGKHKEEEEDDKDSKTPDLPEKSPETKSRLQGIERNEQETTPKSPEEAEQKQPPPKRIPVFFLDEAHKLPALIQAEDAMKIILDSLLVLTKQDRLCHCVHATSDPYYMTFLRQENIAQHAKILSIGDCDKAETRRYFEEQLLPDMPQQLQDRLPSFEEIYAAFGGKLAHWQDFASDYSERCYTSLIGQRKPQRAATVNADGKLAVRGSSHYLQAYALLNLHLIHAAPGEGEGQPDPEDGLADGTGGGGFQIYSSLFAGSKHAAPAPGSGASSVATRDELVKILRTLRKGGWETDYFALCRKMGAGPVDAAVRGRICELRWTPTVSPEGDPDARSQDFIAPRLVPITPIVRLAMDDVLKELSL